MRSARFLPFVSIRLSCFSLSLMLRPGAVRILCPIVSPFVAPRVQFPAHGGPSRRGPVLPVEGVILFTHVPFLSPMSIEVFRLQSVRPRAKESIGGCLVCVHFKCAVVTHLNVSSPEPDQCSHDFTFCPLAPFEVRPSGPSTKRWCGFDISNTIDHFFLHVCAQFLVVRPCLLYSCPAVNLPCRTAKKEVSFEFSACLLTSFLWPSRFSMPAAPSVFPRPPLLFLLPFSPSFLYSSSLPCVSARTSFCLVATVAPCGGFFSLAVPRFLAFVRGCPFAPVACCGRPASLGAGCAPAVVSGSLVFLVVLPLCGALVCCRCLLSAGRPAAVVGVRCMVSYVAARVVLRLLPVGSVLRRCFGLLLRRLASGMRGCLCRPCSRLFLSVRGPGRVPFAGGGSLPVLLVSFAFVFGRVFPSPARSFCFLLALFWWPLSGVFHLSPSGVSPFWLPRCCRLGFWLGSRCFLPCGCLWLLPLLLFWSTPFFRFCVLFSVIPLCLGLFWFASLSPPPLCPRGSILPSFIWSAAWFLLSVLSCFFIVVFSLHVGSVSRFSRRRAALVLAFFRPLLLLPVLLAPVPLAPSWGRFSWGAPVPVYFPPALPL